MSEFCECGDVAVRWAFDLEEDEVNGLWQGSFES